MSEEKIPEEKLIKKELEEYAEGENSIWVKGSFVQSISKEELKKKKRTIGMSHYEEMNFNCKNCNKKISTHNKDWHDSMCDECFNNYYFPDKS